VTLVPGSPGDGKGLVGLRSVIGGRWDAGDRGDTLISNTSVSNAVAAIQTDFAAVHTAAQPASHAFTFTLNNTATITTVTVGTAHWGQ
jgi:hypothetical protein